MNRKVDIATLDREVREVHDTFPTWSLDNAFVHWFLQAFLESDAELAARAVTGVSHDKGCDAIFIDDRLGKVFLLQGKYHRGPSPRPESRSDVLSFAGLARRVLGTDHDLKPFLTRLDPLVSRKLTEARARLKRKGYELRLYYVTTGQCSAALKSEAEAEVAQASGHAELSVLDRKDILSLLVDYLGGAADLLAFFGPFLPRGGLRPGSWLITASA